MPGKAYLKPTSHCNAFKLNNMTMIMNMEDKLNIHNSNMKGLENPCENHTVIQTRKLIQMQT